MPVSPCLSQDMELKEKRMTIQTIPAIRKVSIGLALAGLLFALVGVLAILHPAVTGLATAFVLSLSFLLAGMGSIFAAFASKVGSDRIVNALFGVMAIAAGILLGIFPLDGAVSFAWLIGAFFAASGMLEIAGVITNSANRGSRALLGVADLAVGLLILVQLPQGALDMLAILVGASFLLRGAVLALLAFALRNPPRIIAADAT